MTDKKEQTRPVAASKPGKEGQLYVDLLDETLGLHPECSGYHISGTDVTITTQYHYSNGKAITVRFSILPTENTDVELVADGTLHELRGKVGSGLTNATMRRLFDFRHTHWMKQRARYVVHGAAIPSPLPDGAFVRLFDVSKLREAVSTFVSYLLFAEAFLAGRLEEQQTKQTGEGGAQDKVAEVLAACEKRCADVLSGKCTVSADEVMATCNEAFVDAINDIIKNICIPTDDGTSKSHCLDSCSEMSAGSEDTTRELPPVDGPLCDTMPVDTGLYMHAMEAGRILRIVKRSTGLVVLVIANKLYYIPDGFVLVRKFRVGEQVKEGERLAVFKAKEPVDTPIKKPATKKKQLVKVADIKPSGIKCKPLEIRAACDGEVVSISRCKETRNFLVVVGRDPRQIVSHTAPADHVLIAQVGDRVERGDLLSEVPAQPMFKPTRLLAEEQAALDTSSCAYQAKAWRAELIKNASTDVQVGKGIAEVANEQLEQRVAASKRDKQLQTPEFNSARRYIVDIDGLGQRTTIHLSLAVYKGGKRSISVGPAAEHICHQFPAFPAPAKLVGDAGHDREARRVARELFSREMYSLWNPSKQHDKEFMRMKWDRQSVLRVYRLVADQGHHRRVLIYAPSVGEAGIPTFDQIPSATYGQKGEDWAREWLTRCGCMSELWSSLV